MEDTHNQEHKATSTIEETTTNAHHNDGQPNPERTQAGGATSSRQDAHRARMPGGGESTRQGSAERAATDVTVYGAPDDVGQHGERAGSIREPRRLGDVYVLVVNIQGGHQSDGDAGKGIADHERGGYREI